MRPKSARKKRGKMPRLRWRQCRSGILPLSQGRVPSRQSCSSEERPRTHPGPFPLAKSAASATCPVAYVRILATHSLSDVRRDTDGLPVEASGLEIGVLFSPKGSPAHLRGPCADSDSPEINR